MLEFERKIYNFKLKDIWWADKPYDVDDCDSVTFHASKNKVDIKGFSSEEFATLITDLTQPLDGIWKGIRGSTRTEINQAKKAGVEIKINQNYEEFYQIDQSFRENKGLPASYDTIDFMKEYGTLFVSELDGEILGGQLYLEDEDHIRVLFGGSRRLGVDKDKAKLIAKATRLTLWEAINYAKEKNIKEFDIGGYYTGNEDQQKININTFKKSFGGTLTTYYIYRKHYSHTYHFLKSLYDVKCKFNSQIRFDLKHPKPY